MEHRAYSLITVKGFDPVKRTFTGIATSPVPDRLDDVIESAGVTFKNPLPLLLYHDSKKPVGETKFGKPTAEGTPFTARISTIDRESGTIRDRLDEAVDSLAAVPPLIRGVSIGFRPLEAPEYIKETGGFRFTKIEVLELSMVVVPAHQDATIDLVKSLDLAARGASATPRTRNPSGASDTTRVSTRTEKNMKSFTEQIKEWEATRAAKAARMDELLTKSGEAGETLSDEEQTEHDELSASVKKIDAQLVRLREGVEREKAAAAIAKGGSTTEGATSRQTAQRITVTRELPKGILFARYAMCMGAARGFPGEAARLAKQHYPDDPGVLALVERTAVTGAATTGSHFIDDMVPYSVMNDFIEYLRPGSIVGKFGGPNPGGGPNYPSLRRVGFNERVSGMSTGLTGAWVGEGLPTLPSAAVTYNAALLFHKLAAMVIMTKESLRFSNPSAEAVFRDELARCINAKMDLDFVDPSKAAVGATSPASITNGIVATTPTGTTAAYFRTNLATMIGNFATGNLDPSDIVLIMSANMALQLSMMVNTLGNNDFDSINMRGGMIRGFPVIVSEHLTAVGSPSTQTIIAVKAGDIYLADDGAVTVEASDQASVEMADTSSQSGITGTGATSVSLWQNGLVGFKATREVTWKLRRSTAVRYISPAAYVA